ncbi:MAG: hypothetical protein IJH40_01235 [Ruminococcus sp.]|uniref:hypothetical protein n=1 Tax=Ruminococcus sp. TaxID=41978 RepID=UPI0028734B83|nr:hypothetical protein [Ruminococcus sp.]MBQ3284238.1 hypothetical protein [Ruminococcus sp.]
MKRLISVLLAVFLLFGALLPAAYAEEADIAEVSAEEEIAGTGDGIAITSAQQMKAYLELDHNDTYVTKLVLMNDISEYIGAEESVNDWSVYHPSESVNGDSNYVPTWCTVGKGQKIIDLNNHHIYLKSCYTAIYDGYDKGQSYIERKSNECLFSIPSGARLTVNGGGTSNTDTGSIVYDGILLNKCDGIDQRDIFHVDGGSLTVNSGRFAPCARQMKYTDPYFTTQQINGTAITVNSGDLTVNGGCFEGRGMNCYNFKYSDYMMDIYYQARNGALEINGGRTTVNDGHFVGVGSGSAVIDMSFGSAENHYYSGHFTVSYDAENYAVQHDKNARKYYNCGIIGAKLDTLDPNANYYTAPYNPVTSAADITNLSDIVNFDPVDFYIRPKSQVNEADGAPKTDNKKIKFLRGTSPVANDETWNLNTQNVLDVDPSTLYFPIIDNTYAKDVTGGKEVRQTLHVFIGVYEYISEGNRPEIAYGITYSPKKRNNDRADTWQIDLNEAIPAETLSKLQNGHDYVIVFDFDENFISQDRKQDVTHQAYYYFTASKASGYTVSGTIDSYLSESDTVQVYLQKSSGGFPSMRTFTGNHYYYTFVGIPDGRYTLTIMKKNHTTRKVDLYVDGKDTQLSTKICPIGDADGNGRVNAADAKAAFQHGNEQKLITDIYKRACADVASPKEKVNSADAKAIFQHANEQKSLWEE